ncbi:hypothetical protein [Streptomyces sp. NPDC020681]|uniref:hypothetical protein n=1 Tax=Streptomyces sp. NPDC020681 TaxID=3365083 RepID=UPI00378D1437
MQHVDIAKALADQAETGSRAARRGSGRRQSAQIPPARFRNSNVRARNLPRRSSY